MVSGLAMRWVLGAPLFGGVAFGQDEVRGEPGQKVSATIVGAGFIRGTDGNDVIVGRPGRDIIVAGEGDDIICGVWGNFGADFVSGGSGYDFVHGDNPNPLPPELGDLPFPTNLGPDFCSGGPGTDTIAACESGEATEPGGPHPRPRPSPSHSC